MGTWKVRVRLSDFFRYVQMENPWETHESRHLHSQLPLQAFRWRRDKIAVGMLTQTEIDQTCL